MVFFLYIYIDFMVLICNWTKIHWLVVNKHLRMCRLWPICMWSHFFCKGDKPTGCTDKNTHTLNPYCQKIIWNRRGHECSRIWKLSADFTLIQCIKIVSIFFGPRYVGDDFFKGRNLFHSIKLSFLTRSSKINFRVENFFSCQYVRIDLIKFENSKIT